jgi:hypothetical protein
MHRCPAQFLAVELRSLVSRRSAHPDTGKHRSLGRSQARRQQAAINTGSGGTYGTMSRSSGAVSHRDTERQVIVRYHREQHRLREGDCIREGVRITMVQESPMRTHMRAIFHLSIPVRDLQEAVDFYANELGADIGRRTETFADALVLEPRSPYRTTLPVSLPPCLAQGTSVPLFPGRNGNLLHLISPEARWSWSRPPCPMRASPPSRAN